jgi:hypothetical protein
MLGIIIRSVGAVDPRAYMRNTLRRILDGEKGLAALLPENYKPRPTAQRSGDIDAARAA